MLHDKTFWDISFAFVNESNFKVGANKCILCNRSLYFDNMLRASSMAESISSEVEIVDHSRHAFEAMLEFIYTSRVQSIGQFEVQQCLDLLNLATEYGLEDLSAIVQLALSRLITNDNVSKLFTISDDVKAEILIKSIKVRGILLVL